MNTRNFWRKALVAAAILLAGAGAATAQLQTGNLYGSVTDNQGQALPGVTVTLTGIGATQTQVTNAEGQFRFLGLSPGSWSIKAELEGFSTVDYPNISIGTGRNTTIEVTMTAALEEVITVTSESPLLDERKVSTGTTVSQTELEKIPTARDPWVILQQTPGVLVDRINVGGNESGQQSAYISPGTSDDNSVWAVDGVVITDMGAIGSSPSYYNFDSFEEMQVTTGGTDVSLATGGVTMNMVTKRGTNEWRFSARYLITDKDWQADTKIANSDLPASQLRDLQSRGLSGFTQGNRIQSVDDYGIEGGGPIVRDRLWVWASYGVQKIDLRTAQNPPLRPDGDKDFTELESYALKINAQLTANNSLTAFYHFGDKVKIGRNASPQRPGPTTWNQSGPTDVYKLEDTHIFNSNFYLTGMASYVGGGFELVPQGGGIGDAAFPNVTRSSGSVWQNSFLLYQTDRPQEQAKLDGNYFFNTGSASHELRFGVGYRSADVDSFSAWPGLQLVGLADRRFTTCRPVTGNGGPCPDNVYNAWSATVRNATDTVEYTNAYVQDTLTFGNFTANIGIRYDLQTGKNNAGSIPSAPVNFGIINGGRFDGDEPDWEWEDITPRLGLTYALGEDRSTLLRLSYSRFADQLGSGIVSLNNPLNYQYAYFYWVDANRDQQLTRNEVGPFRFNFGSIEDPNNPGHLIHLNQFSSDFGAPITDELLLSVEHALAPEFLVSLQATWRKYSDILETELLVDDNGVVRPHRRSDYVQIATLRDNCTNATLAGRPTCGQAGFTGVDNRLPGGRAWAVPLWDLNNDPVFYTGGNFYKNGDREQDYLGLTLGFNKRLANRWLLRGHVTWTDWEWSVPDSENESPNITIPGGTQDGDPVVVGSGTGSGAKGGIYINSEWSADISGMYQVAPDRPWGFNLAANVNARQGYAIPYGRVAANSFALVGLQTTNSPTEFRHDDVVIFNARIEKEFTFSDWGITVSLDGFNLFNENYILQRQIDQSSTRYNWVTETTSPQIFRIGARVNFR